MAGAIPFDVAGAAIQIFKDNKKENEPSTTGISQMVCTKKKTHNKSRVRNSKKTYDVK